MVRETDDRKLKEACEATFQEAERQPGEKDCLLIELNGCTSIARQLEERQVSFWSPVRRRSHLVTTSVGMGAVRVLPVGHETCICLR